ncbi:phosphatidylglycerophosphatase A family protein [Kaarinaea lacus]
MANSNRSVDRQDQPKGKTKPGSPVYWLAIGLGSGLAPKAPGTVGTLVAIPLYLLLSGLWLWQYVAVVIAGFLIGIWICGTAARQLGVHDDPSIVWDEIIGYLITMIAAPSGWLWIGVGFVLFRIFDIVKPWPICVIDQRMSGGLGIMFDDVLAGIYALVALQLLAQVSV